MRYACFAPPPGAALPTLTALSPRITAPDAAGAVLLDLGRRRDLAEDLAWAARLRIAAPAAALGLAATQTVAQVAAQTAGAGHTLLIAPGYEAAFLAPLPLTVLPLAPALLARLARFGLMQIGQAAALPPGALLAQFGSVGRTLHDLTHGRDLAPLVAAPPTPTITVGWRFPIPVSDACQLTAIIQPIATALTRRLGQDGYAAAALTITLDTEDPPPLVQTRTFPAPTADPIVLRAALTALLTTAPIAAPVTCVRVTLHGLVAITVAQADMFAAPAPAAALAATAARLAPRWDGQLLRATLTNGNARLLEDRVTLEPR